MNCQIVEGAEQIKIEDVVRLLRTTYWAENRSTETIEKSVRHSACYGVYVAGEEKLVGFARVISDCATSFYLCDVVVDEKYRHQGLGTALVSHIVSSPSCAGLRGILITRDAHSLYRKFGFEVLNDRAMVRPPKV